MHEKERKDLFKLENDPDNTRIIGTSMTKRHPIPGGPGMTKRHPIPVHHGQPTGDFTWSP